MFKRRRDYCLLSNRDWKPEEWRVCVGREEGRVCACVMMMTGVFVLRARARARACSHACVRVCVRACLCVYVCGVDLNEHGDPTVDTHPADALGSYNCV